MECGLLEGILQGPIPYYQLCMQYSVDIRRENQIEKRKYCNYLGMDLDFSEKGAVKVSMIKYLKKIVDSFPE